LNLSFLSFENLDKVLESFCKGMNSITEDLGKMDKDFHDDVKRSNSSHKREARKNKQNIEKIFGSKKSKLF